MHAAAAGALILASWPLHAADPLAGYPVKPIRVVIAQEAGSSVDTNICLLAPLLGDALGRSLVVDNRPGAGGTLGIAIGTAFAQFMRDDMARFGIAAKATDLKVE